MFGGLMRPLILAILLLLPSAESLLAAALDGRVIDLESKQPVAMAAIFIGTAARTESDANGVFRVENLPAGEYLIRVEHGQDLIIIPGPVFVPVHTFEHVCRGCEREAAGSGIPFRREAGDREYAWFL